MGPLSYMDLSLTRKLNQGYKEFLYKLICIATDLYIYPSIYLSIICLPMKIAADRDKEYMFVKECL